MKKPEQVRAGQQGTGTRRYRGLCVDVRGYGRRAVPTSRSIHDTARINPITACHEGTSPCAAISPCQSRTSSRGAGGLFWGHSEVISQEASRLKDEFLGSLSYEPWTPLNAVLGYVRVLRNGILSPEEQARAIETVEMLTP